MVVGATFGTVGDCSNCLVGGFTDIFQRGTAKQLSKQFVVNFQPQNWDGCGELVARNLSTLHLHANIDT